jgi:uncharacterized membrane protein
MFREFSLNPPVAGQADSWSRWPFGPGLGGEWLATIGQFAFIGLILAGIILLLRLFFGPGGWLRDTDLDEEAEQDKRSRQEALDILRKRFAAGEITEQEFTERKRVIEE